MNDIEKIIDDLLEQADWTRALEQSWTARVAIVSLMEQYGDSRAMSARLSELESLKKIDCFNEAYSSDARPSRMLDIRINALKAGTKGNDLLTTDPDKQTEASLRRKKED